MPVLWHPGKGAANEQDRERRIGHRAVFREEIQELRQANGIGKIQRGVKRFWMVGRQEEFEVADGWIELVGSSFGTLERGTVRHGRLADAFEVEGIIERERGVEGQVFDQEPDQAPIDLLPGRLFQEG